MSKIVILKNWDLESVILAVGQATRFYGTPVQVFDDLDVDIEHEHVSALPYKTWVKESQKFVVSQGGTSTTSFAKVSPRVRGDWVVVEFENSGAFSHIIFLNSASIIGNEIMPSSYKDFVQQIREIDMYLTNKHKGDTELVKRFQALVNVRAKMEQEMEQQRRMGE